MPLVAPVVSWASGEQSRGATYTSDLIVKNNCKYTSWEDLKGSVFAYNDDVSLSGYVSLKIWMHENKPAHARIPYFSKSYATGSHFNSICAVAAGTADCAVIDRITREAIERENPHMKSKYRILKDVIIGDMPAQPICIRKQIDKVTRNKILDAFLRTDCSTSKEMKKLSFVKYEAVNHDFYVNLANRISNSEYVVLSNLKRPRQCSGGNKTDGKPSPCRNTCKRTKKT